ncbi:7TM diverse intracellular signaling domain-containing protein [Marinobacter salarius]|jgi:signal transduction histidine kinase/ActR/RegA family two-component response regulator|uniref:7TM diverse intracellular signaling domain-containing protein n=1 Tax=Marinobacter salarius TaxID=1420917 RepID=UPI0018F16F64|nr:7TM diverse intracellular signaling domain-containing protein [Marinobacter salarius]MBJ7274933.1 response regulator [Marinobacter salarius]
MHGVVRNIGVHQVVIAFMVFVFPGYVMAADQETIIKELGPYMELYQGSWDNREPPPEGQGKWIPLKTQNYATSETDGPIWLRTQLENLDASKNYWLILHPYAQQVSVYLDGQRTTPTPIHFFSEMDARPVPHHYIVAPLPMSESQLENSTLHLKIDPYFPVSTFFRLTDERGLIKELTLHTALGFGLLAVIAIMAIYNLFLFFSIRDTVYLWYVAVSCASLVYSAMLTNVGIYIIADWGMPPTFGFFAGTTAFLLQLVLFQRLLATRTTFPRLHHTVSAVVAIGAGIVMISPLLPYKIFTAAILLLAYSSYIGVLVMACVRAIQGYRPAQYFLVGWGPFVASLFLTTFEYLGLIAPTSWVSYFVPVGVSWEMALFSLALASRIKILRDERDTLQAQQIEVSEKARKTLERSNQIKDDFLNAVSHELRTPLHTIQGQIDLLRAAALNTQQKQAFHVIEYANLRLTRQVGGILDFVDAQDENLISSPQVFELQSLFDLMEDEFRERAQAKPVSLTFDIHDTVPRKVFMDGLMLEKVLYQLIDNAMKFTPSGGQVMIHCSNSADDSLLQILVSDTGPGIPNDQLNKVFQAFQQGEAGLTRRYGGIGLGLPLASSLAMALNGHINVVASSNRGTTIEVHVPYGEVYLSQTSNTEFSDSDPVGRLLRVLVVEDDAGNRMILRKQLDKMGVVSECVQNGLEAVEAASKESWDIIIMDCQMPVMDGIEATRAIRQKATPNLDTPIIAITANTSESYRLQCLEAGMDDYYTKPLRMEKLKKLVSTYAKSSNVEPAEAGDKLPAR